MKPEELESLFHSYIDLRWKSRGDVPDGSLNLGVETDNPILRPCFGDQYLPQGGPPLAPFQLSEFGSLTAQPPEVITLAQNLLKLADDYTAAHPEKSVIHFKEYCIVNEPKEHILSIPVIRLKSFDKVVKVTWKTCDKTACSGIHYVGSSGEIVFDKGETEKRIEIKILNSPGNGNDLRFIVELCHVGGLFNPTPLTVSLRKTEIFYANERQVLDSFPRSPPFSISDIKFILDGCLNNRTFHMAMTHLCSSTDNVHAQFALAFELGSLCLDSLSRESILNTLTDYFRMDGLDF